MRYKILIALLLVGCLGIGFSTQAQISSLWKVVSGVLSPVVSSWGVSMGKASTTDFAITTKLNCGKLYTNAVGAVICGTDATGAGGAGLWASTTGNDDITPLSSTAGVIVNASSTFTGDFTIGSTSTPLFIDAGGNINFDSNVFVINTELNKLGIRTATPAVPLDLDANSNTEGLRIRGADEANEMVDMYLGSTGTFIMSLTGGNDSDQFFDFRSEDDNYGLILRESDGTGTSVLANFYVLDGSPDYLNIVLNAGNGMKGLILDANGNLGLGTTTMSHKLNIPGSVLAEYYYATSTTATSTFLGHIDITGNLKVGTIIGGAWQGTAIGDAYLTKTGNWTGTLDGYEGNTLLNEGFTSTSANYLLNSSTTIPNLSCALNEILKYGASNTWACGATSTWSIDGCADCLNATEIEDIYLLDDGDAGTGAFDFGGATSFEISNGLNLTIDAAGELAVDTSHGQLVYYATSTRAIVYDPPHRPTMSSSTAANDGAYGANGTTTYIFDGTYYGETITHFHCRTDEANTTFAARYGDGSNWGEYVVCDFDGQKDDASLTNNVFLQWEAIYLQVGSQNLDPDMLIFTIHTAPTRQ